MERGVAVKDLEDEEMDRIGGIEQSVLPGVVFLARGGVDGVFVEQRGDVLLNAAKDAHKSVLQLHRRVLQRSRRRCNPSTLALRRRTLSRSACRNCYARWMLRHKSMTFSNVPICPTDYVCYNVSQACG